MEKVIITLLIVAGICRIAYYLFAYLTFCRAHAVGKTMEDIADEQPQPAGEESRA